MVNPEERKEKRDPVPIFHDFCGVVKLLKNQRTPVAPRLEDN